MAMNNNSQLLGNRGDSEWIRQALLVPVHTTKVNASARDASQTQAMQFSYQSLAFADTSLGGNRAMNPKPQFTRFADQKLPSLVPVNNGTSGSIDFSTTLGMGRYYAETIDRNANMITLQFGSPGYNSLTNFFGGFYDPGWGNMVNNGVTGSDLLFTMSKWVGYLTMWAIAPGLAITNIIYNTSKKFMANVQHQPLTRFYYMKPTMTLYWSTVTVIVNALCVNMHLAGGISDGDISRSTSNETNVPPGSVKINIDQYNADTGNNATTLANLARILPDIMLDGGGINIRAVANRYQRLADAHHRVLQDIQNSVTDDVSAYQAIQNYIHTGIPSMYLQPLNYPDQNSNITAYQNSVAGTGLHLFQDIVEGIKATFSSTPAADTPPDKQIDNSAAVSAQGDAVGAQADTVALNGASFWTGLTTHLSKYADYAIAEARDGSNFVNFYVDWESHVSESFSSTTKESSIAEKMNQVSRDNKDRLFNTAQGNISDSIIANTIEGVVSGVTSIMAGLAASVGLSGLALLGGRALVDIPEFWDSSTSTLPTSSYNIQLRTPYGNPISVLTNILIPTAMWIAAAAPRSTGRNSYNGPFLCKLWQKGRVQIQLGMVTNLSITRGTGNVGWNIHGQPIGIDLNITISNLSKMLHIPITTDLSISDVIGLTAFDEDNNFTDYMAILGSLGLSEQYYLSSRWRLRRATTMMNFDSFWSSANFMNWLVGDTIPGSLMSIAAQKGFLGS